jgi:DNA-binding winged helix-turn-helix (wHTH) protein
MDGTEKRKLSFREAELLKYLYANRNKIIDRKEILNLLWVMILSTQETWMYIWQNSAAT